MQEMNVINKLNKEEVNMRTMKSWKKVILTGIVVCTLALPTLASAEEMMAKQVDYSGIQTMIQNGTELVPLRQVAELLGFKVTWQDETRSIVLTKMMMGDMGTVGDKKMEDKSMMEDKSKLDDKAIMGDKSMMDGTTIVIQIDSMKMKSSGMDGILMYAPMLINSMTYVPKAFVDTYLLK